MSTSVSSSRLAICRCWMPTRRWRVSWWAAEPDPVRFHATVDQLIARACKDRLPCPVRAYGEMVDVLWKRANAEGAIRLEMLWNRVATQAQFSLLCGYAVGNFYKEVATGPTFQTVCDQHNHVIPMDKIGLTPHVSPSATADSLSVRSATALGFSPRC